MNFDDLVERGLVQKKSYTEGPYAGLSVVKYSRKVFYDQLWNVDSRLLDARGMVLDAEGNRVIWPFTKVFNHHENNTECLPNAQVIAVEKINGFMASATIHNGELLVATTGTLDSEFVGLAKEHIFKLNVFRFSPGYTYLFEICDPSDPHIVDQEQGAYLIGIRRMADGSMVGEADLDYIGSWMGAMRPSWCKISFEGACFIAKNCEHEGYMIRNTKGEYLMKIKSPYYLVKKFLMRMGAGKTELMTTNPTKFKESIDEEYYPLVDFISTSYRQSWKDMDQFERCKVIEDYFYGN